MKNIEIKVENTRYLFVVAMLYAVINVADTSLVYKIVELGPAVITAGALLSPLVYLICDVIAEVYGYNKSRQVIWVGLLTELLFISLCFTLIHLPSPSYWHLQDAYNKVLGGLPRIYLGSIVGTISSSFLNTYLVSRWKIILKGKYFWIRSISASAVGQLVFCITTAAIDLVGVIPTKDILKAALISYGMKIILIPFLALPVSLLAAFLKSREDNNFFDIDISFNPFKIG